MIRKSPKSRRSVLRGLSGLTLAAFAAEFGLAPATAALAQTHDDGGHSGGGKGGGGKAGSGGHDDGGHTDGGDDGGHDDGGHTDGGHDDGGGDDGGHADGGGGKGQGGKGGRGGRPGDGVIRQGRGHSIEDRVFRLPEG